MLVGSGAVADADLLLGLLTDRVAPTVVLLDRHTAATRSPHGQRRVGVAQAACTEAVRPHRRVKGKDGAAPVEAMAEQVDRRVVLRRPKDVDQASLRGALC